MRRAGVTQAHVAREAGVDASMVSKVVAGAAVSKPVYDTILRLIEQGRATR